MKKLIALALVVFGLTATLIAQTPEFTNQPPAQVVDWSNGSIELRVQKNGWRNSGGPYDTPLLYALIAQIVQKELGSNIGSSTQEIILAGFELDALSDSKWTDKSSPRLEEGKLKPTLWAFEIVTGGSSSESRRNNITIGDISVGTESGSSEAWIAIVVKDLTTGSRIATITGKSKYSSVNVDDFRSRRSLFGIPFGNRINWSTYDSDPRYRRGMVSTARAFEDLKKNLRLLVLPASGGR